MSDNENKDLENINGEEEQKVTIPSTGEQVDIEDIIDNGVADDLVEGSTDEEKKENKKKLKQQLLISAGIGKNVIDKTLDVVMHESMLPYSEHVILDRALPRVEDGLKPVQRRILYTMYEQNLTPDKPHKKSAKVVGDCLGKYHPHGDSSVYDAMVRLAQDFNLRAPLLDGHGNFGSVDGDSAAAMRYTEIRMAPLALEMLRDLEKNTVPWQWNYDDTLQEPVLLPSRFPNLLVNGASGIAVGLATNIPPHNLAETISGAIAYIDNPDITLDEMMKIIKAPDFPTGGFVIGGEDLKQAYATGKGKILIRSKVHIENDTGDKKNIVITEIPYQVNKAKLEQKILELKETKKDILSGINDIVDESDKHGDRIVIKLKKDTDVKKVLNCLFKYTDMQVSYGINMVAIADGRPQQMGLIDILAYYVNFQREVIYKRTKFDLDAAKERQHILQGLIIAVRNIDEVVRIIKTSDNVTTAKSRLRERFSLSDKQAQAILDMRLARLTSLEVFKLEQELLELEKRIAELTKILSSKRMQFEIVKEEMGEIRKKFKDGRKSDILASEDEYEVSSAATTGAKGPSENVVVCATALGTIKCMSTRHFSQCSKVWSERSGLQEVILSSIDTMSDKTVLGFSDKGNAYKIDVSLLGDNKFRDKGTPLNKIMPSALPDEKIVYLMESEANLISKDLLFFTECGMIKKTNVSEYQLLKSAYQAIKLKDGDKVIKIEEDKPDTTILFVTKQGMGLNASKDDIPVQGRISAGVKGIALSEGDSVVFVSQISKDDNVILVSNKAYAKKLNVNEIDVLARYRKGVKVFDLKGKDSSGTEVLAAGLAKQNTDVVVQTLDEEYQAINASNIEEDTRASKGKSMSIGNAIILSAFVRTL